MHEGDRPAGEDRQGVEDGTTAVLQAMLTTFSDVLSVMDRRMTDMEAVLHGLRADEDQTAELRLALRRLGRLEAVEAELTELRTALVGHPVIAVHDAIGRLVRQVDSLVAQPGPGPAMAMVAAGLSERFESRTHSLVELIQEHAELMHALTGQVEAAMQRLLTTVEGRQAGLDALLDTVRAIARTVEGMGVRIDEARDRMDAVFRAGEDLPRVVGSLRELEDAVGKAARTVAAEGAGGSSGLVREELGTVARQLAEVSTEVAAVKEMLAAHVDDSAQSLSRKASEAGRRLAAEFGLSSLGRSKPQPAPRLEPSKPQAPPPAREAPPQPEPPPGATPKSAATPPPPPPKRSRKAAPKR